MTDLLDQLENYWDGFMESLIGPRSSSLVDTFGQAIVTRALELAKGQPPEANLMPYINRALDEVRANQPS